MEIDIGADFVADSVPAILVLGGLLAVLVGWLAEVSGAGWGIPWWAWLLIGLGILIYVLGASGDGGV